MSPLKKGIKSF